MATLSRQVRQYNVCDSYVIMRFWLYVYLELNCPVKTDQALGNYTKTKIYNYFVLNLNTINKSIFSYFFAICSNQVPDICIQHETEENVGSEEIVQLSDSQDDPTDTNFDSNFDNLYASLLFNEINSDLIDSELSETINVESINAESASSDSVVHESKAEDNEVSLKTILEQKRHSICKTQTTKFNICRSNIWEGTKRAMLRKSFSPSNKISVKFTDDIGMSEGAVDLGGPMRECMTLVLEYLTHSELFTGPNNSKLLSCSGKCLEESEYFLVGQLIAMSLVHVGIGPRCLSPILFECLTGRPDKVSVSLEDVCDHDVRSLLKELLDSKTIEEAQDMMHSANLETLIDIAGNFKVVKSLDDVKKIVNSTVYWFVLGRTRASLESFKEGLASFDILNSIVANPLAFKPEMCFTEQVITNEMMTELFCVSRSEIGSNKYELESILLSFWQDLLVDIEDGDVGVTYSDILFFSSGYKVIPSITFLPEMKFLHEVEQNGLLSHYPKSNTCASTLYLPTIHKNYDDFKQAVTFAVLNSKGFGCP